MELSKWHRRILQPKIYRIISALVLKLAPKKSAKNKQITKHPHLIVDSTGRIIGLNQFLTKEGAEILLNSTSNNIFSKVNQKNT